MLIQHWDYFSLMDFNEFDLDILKKKNILPHRAYSVCTERILGNHSRICDIQPWILQVLYKA